MGGLFGWLVKPDYGERSEALERTLSAISLTERAQIVLTAFEFVDGIFQLNPDLGRRFESALTEPTSAVNKDSAQHFYNLCEAERKTFTKRRREAVSRLVASGKAKIVDPDKLNHLLEMSEHAMLLLMVGLARHLDRAVKESLERISPLLWECRTHLDDAVRLHEIGAQANPRSGETGTEVDYTNVKQTANLFLSTLMLGG